MEIKPGTHYKSLSSGGAQHYSTWGWQTYSNNHDAVVQESKSNERKRIVQQNCKKKEQTQTHQTDFSCGFVTETVQGHQEANKLRRVMFVLIFTDVHAKSTTTQTLKLLSCMLSAALSRPVVRTAASQPSRKTLLLLLLNCDGFHSWILKKV